MLDEIRKQIKELAQNGGTAVAVDAPTLIESGFHRECNVVLSVLAPSDLRLHRIIARDHMSEERAEARIASQQPDEFYRVHSHAVLINDGDAKQFRKRAEALLTQLLPRD